MKKPTRTLSILFLFVMIFGFPTWIPAEEPLLYFLYMKNGTAMRCDAVWMGMGDYVWCTKSRGKQGYPQTEVEMNRTFKIQPTVNRLVDRSLVSFNKADWDSTVAAASGAIALDPHNEVAYTNRAGAYAHKGMYQEAINDCNEAIRINPNFGLAYNNRGYALERTGRLEQALADYETSCRLGNDLGCNNCEKVSVTLKVVRK